MRPRDRDDAGVADGADAEGELSVKGFPDGSALAGPRLDLEPLRVEHAQEMAPLLDDPGLYVFISVSPRACRSCGSGTGARPWVAHGTATSVG